MQRLLFVLVFTSISYLSYGQILNFNELITIKSTLEFEEIMYNKKMRFIRKSESYSLWEYHKKINDEGKSRWWNGEFSYSDETTEPESYPEFYEIRRGENCSFGKNYNSSTETAEFFCERSTDSKWKNFPNRIDRSDSIPSYSFNSVVYRLTFITPSQFDDFWETINFDLIYSKTKQDGTRVYKFSNDFIFKIKDYDNGQTFLEIEILQ